MTVHGAPARCYYALALGAEAFGGGVYASTFLQSAVDLLSAARTLECGLLRELCCATLAEPLLQACHRDAFVRALEPIVCENLRLALVGEVMEWVLDKGGGETALRRAVDAGDGAPSSPKWLVDAARSALERAVDRRRREREAETQRVHLGLDAEISMLQHGFVD